LCFGCFNLLALFITTATVETYGLDYSLGTDHVRNEEVLLRVKEICKQKANCIGHILRRNCLLQQVIERKIKGKIEVTGRRGRRCRKLLDDLNLLAPEFYI
jgi:hypothetical protein